MASLDEWDEDADSGLDWQQKGRLPPDSLDGLENEPISARQHQHLTPAYVFESLDQQIADYRAAADSRLDETKEYSDGIQRILKGDSGEGYTYVRLLERYDADRIGIQPELIGAAGKNIQPDFAVRSSDGQGSYEEIVDSKAWSLLKPKGVDGGEVSQDRFMRSLLDHPNPSRLQNMRHLQDVVERYSGSPQLTAAGRIALYFPEDVFRYAPQVVQEIESWSYSDFAHGRAVEVRSIGVWNSDLWAAARRR